MGGHDRNLQKNIENLLKNHLNFNHVLKSNQIFNDLCCTSEGSTNLTQPGALGTKKFRSALVVCVRGT